MGRKLKLTKIIVLFALYFFLIQYSVLSSALCAGVSAQLRENGPDVGRPVRGDVLSNSTASVEGGEEVYLIASTGVYFLPNTSVTLPEGVHLVVVITLPLIISENDTLTNETWTYYVTINSNITNATRFSLPKGIRHLEVIFSYTASISDNTTDENVTKPGVPDNSTEIISYNMTLARWDITIISREAYEAMTAPETEPLGLRRKSALVAAITAAIAVPFGMYIRRKRYREEVL